MTTRLFTAIALLTCALISAGLILPFPHAWAPLSGLAIFLLVMGAVILPSRHP